MDNTHIIIFITQFFNLPDDAEDELVEDSEDLSDGFSGALLEPFRCWELCCFCVLAFGWALGCGLGCGLGWGLDCGPFLLTGLFASPSESVLLSGEKMDFFLDSLSVVAAFPLPKKSKVRIKKNTDSLLNNFQQVSNSIWRSHMCDVIFNGIYITKWNVIYENYVYSILQTTVQWKSFIQITHGFWKYILLRNLNTYMITCATICFFAILYKKNNLA